MKTPDEIKKGLETCSTKKPCASCPMYDECKEASSLKPLWDNALAYIQQLEADNAELLTKVERLERERDAAVEDLRNARNCCRFCKNDDGPFECKTTPKSDHSCFEWRGVKEE